MATKPVTPMSRNATAHGNRKAISRSKMMKEVVPMAGLEPARLAPPPPQDGVSTNSTTSAHLQRDNLALLTLA